jgi:hypothetical protein
VKAVRTQVCLFWPSPGPRVPLETASASTAAHAGQHQQPVVPQVQARTLQSCASFVRSRSINLPRSTGRQHIQSGPRGVDLFDHASSVRRSPVGGAVEHWQKPLPTKATYVYCETISFSVKIAKGHKFRLSMRSIQHNMAQFNIGMSLKCYLQ